MTDIQEKLVIDNMQLVYGVIRDNCPRYIHDDDVIQAGNLGLCMAAINWNSEQGEFSTYAYTCIRNSILNEFRQRNKHKGVISLDYELTDDEGCTTPLIDLIVGEEDVSYIDWDTVYEQLSPREMAVLEYKKLGLNGYEIAVILNVSHETVYAILRRIKKIIKENTI